ncbi:hypothetical protein F511_40180 [Dorcoceras hygrometricum]|uniref:Uncharacterized protein n=1 Tax=Dorcoceras hygrometricum TaxID=472368 RepID=A0A2Z7B258_9LAMI|nr:hypothetical protein F511_40180 [Dorcoceras hygrometricum]
MLKEFLGCPAVFYEAALTDFFTNGSVREDGMVVSTIRGTNIEISESMFAAAFELPTEGLTDLSNVPKNLVFDARSLFSESKEKIPVDDKGKEPLLQKDPVKGNLVQEQILLIVADVECLVQLREKIIGEVEEFFHSFSRLKWAKLQQEYFSAKIEQVLTWAETDSTIITLQRKAYVLLKYREMLLRKFIEARILNFVPGGDRGIVISVDSGVQSSSVLLTEFLEQDLQIADSPVFESQNVQIDQNSALVAPFVQLLDEHLSSASTSDTSSMRFDGTDVATTALSLPATDSTAPDVTEVLNQLRSSS